MSIPATTIKTPSTRAEAPVTEVGGQIPAGSTTPRSHGIEGNRPDSRLQLVARGGPARPARGVSISYQGDVQLPSSARTDLEIKIKEALSTSHVTSGQITVHVNEVNRGSATGFKFAQVSVFLKRGNTDVKIGSHKEGAMDPQDAAVRAARRLKIQVPEGQ